MQFRQHVMFLHVCNTLGMERRPFPSALHNAAPERGNGDGRPEERREHRCEKSSCQQGARSGAGMWKISTSTSCGSTEAEP